MNSKIKNYVEGLFSDVPRSNKSNKLKEEILSNMSERFEGYIRDGKTENQSYSLAVSSLGHIDEILADVMPNDEFLQQAYYFRNRNAINTSISVSMYIVGAAILIGMAGLGQILGNPGTYAVIGLLVLLLIVAISTGIIIYSAMSTPQEFKDYNKKAKLEPEHLNTKGSDLLKNIMSVYWTIITVIYLGISFTTGLWAITWIIWVLASVFEPLMKIYLGRKHSK